MKPKDKVFLVILTIVSILIFILSPIASLVAIATGQVGTNPGNWILAFILSPGVITAAALGDKHEQWFDPDGWYGRALLVAISAVYWLTLLGIAELIFRH